MSQKILVTNFSYDMTGEEFKKTVTELAPAFAEVPGCEWKIWLIDDAKKEAGAVYLFKDSNALETFKNSELVAGVLSHPKLSNFELRDRDIVAEASAITRAPLAAKAM